MRTFRCVCDNRIFFDNSRCLTCGRDLGFCPVCRCLTGLEPGGSGELRCGQCDARLALCRNYAEHDVCNRCVSLDRSQPGDLCDCCRFNATIPDLSVPGNLQKWYRLEAAKRRLFYDLDQLGLPYGTQSDGIDPPLAFDFKADVIPADDFWRPMSDVETVFTGHANGRITINIREADEVEREKLRVDMGEAHRTLIGHFRHEIGHYYWDLLVKGRREDQSRAVFGDHDHPTYAEALDRYYQQGAPSDWASNFVSAYATMHPWEDFAETFATYLDMVSTLDTAEHNELISPSGGVGDLDFMVDRYQPLGIALNEVNRCLGLLDVVPEVFVPAVIEKLRFIHELIDIGRSENSALSPARTSGGTWPSR